MNDRSTKTLPGCPTIALDIASARRWINRILKKVDMGQADETNLRAAIDSLRSLERSAKSSGLQGGAEAAARDALPPAEDPADARLAEAFAEPGG
jgi:hypothetical protein